MKDVWKDIALLRETLEDTIALLQEIMDHMTLGSHLRTDTNNMIVTIRRILNSYV